MYTSYLDLPLHGDAEEHDEVHYKYRPEHRHIEGFKKRANHGDDDAFRCRMPGKTSKTSLSLNSRRKLVEAYINNILNSELVLYWTFAYFFAWNESIKENAR